MNPKQRPNPQYVDVLVDFEAMRAQAAAYGIRRSQMPSDEMFRFGPSLAAAIIAGFFVCALAPVVFSFFSETRANALGSNDKYVVSEKVKRNAEVLRRSRAWWKGYGRRHLQARRSVVNVTD